MLHSLSNSTRASRCVVGHKGGKETHLVNSTSEVVRFRTQVRERSEVTPEDFQLTIFIYFLAEYSALH